MMNIQRLFGVKGKVVVITGGSRGIGLMIAHGFVENGAKVYISSRKKEVCDAVASELSLKGICISLPADMTTSEGRKYLIDEITNREIKLDVLVNNAGTAWGAKFEDHPEKGYDRVMDLNVTSMFFLTQGFIPLLSKNDFSDPSRVINIGSIDGLTVPAWDNSAYSVSKAAVHQLTKVLAGKIARHAITVNAIAPGPFESKMTEVLLSQARKEVEKICPLERIGIDEDMAGIAIYLASKAGAYVNGAIIPVDGGIHLKSQDLI